MQAELQVEQLISERLQPVHTLVDDVRKSYSDRFLQSQQLLARAVDAVQRYQRRSKAAELASGIFDGLAGGFLAISILLFTQGTYSIATGFLGPAVAAIVGSLAFRSRKIRGG